MKELESRGGEGNTGVRAGSTTLRAIVAAVAVTLLVALAVGVNGGCSGDAGPARRPVATFEPEITPFSDLGMASGTTGATAADAPTPLYVAFGKTLITPASQLPGHGNRARLDDGRAVTIMSHRLSALPLRGANAAETEALRWLGGAYQWAESTSGAEFVEVALPVDAFGHWLWLGERRVNLQWLGDAKEALPRAAPDILKRAEDPFVRECLGLEARDPRLAWRASLLAVSVARPIESSPPIPFASIPSLVEPPQSAALLDRLSEQTAALWRAALAALLHADAPIHRQVVDQLALVVEFPSGGRTRSAPAWPGAGECAALLERLLRHRDEPRRLAAVAREWLQARPVASGWVFDDAGLLEGSAGVPLVRVGVANFGPSRSLASARGVIDSGSPELIPLAPRATATLPVAPLLYAAPRDGSAEPWGVEIRCGDWAGVVNAQRRHLIALPPGLTINSLLLDHAATPWSRSQALVPLANANEDRRNIPALAGRLVRDAGPSGVGVGSGWSLYLEAERSTSERQTIRVWFGPFAAPSAVVTSELPEITTIPESGEGTATVRLPGRGESQLIGARVVPAPDRWTLRLPIPNSAIESPGRLRFAIEHVRGGVRSTWPRAMFPWQTEPGRASVDLSKW